MGAMGCPLALSGAAQALRQKPLEAPGPVKCGLWGWGQNPGPELNAWGLYRCGYAPSSNQLCC